MRFSLGCLTVTMARPIENVTRNGILNVLKASIGEVQHSPEVEQFQKLYDPVIPNLAQWVLRQGQIALDNLGHFWGTPSAYSDQSNLEYLDVISYRLHLVDQCTFLRCVVLQDVPC